MASWESLNSNCIYKQKYSDHKVVFFLHWNMISDEFEHYFKFRKNPLNDHIIKEDKNIV